jgi:tetratricopeptide (TPR) repeat protein
MSSIVSDDKMVNVEQSFSLMKFTGRRRVRPMASTDLFGRAVIGLAAALFLTSSALAVPPGSSTASASFALCEEADTLSGEERTAALARGMALAEQALAADEHDGRAHFAIVCNLGKQMQAEGIGFSQLFKLRRLRRSADAALAAAPGDADALAAKGALLLRLPRWLGGDVAEAERLLRRAVAAEPENGTARCYLSQALRALEAKGEARALPAPC